MPDTYQEPGNSANVCFHHFSYFLDCLPVRKGGDLQERRPIENSRDDGPVGGLLGAIAGEVGGMLGAQAAQYVGR